MWHNFPSSQCQAVGPGTILLKHGMLCCAVLLLFRLRVLQRQQDHQQALQGVDAGADRRPGMHSTVSVAASWQDGEMPFPALAACGRHLQVAL